MLIFCDILHDDIYNKLRNNIENVFNIMNNVSNEQIIMGAIPIKYGDNYWILSSLANLEFSEKNHKLNYVIKYIINEENSGKIIINKVKSVHDINIDTTISELDTIDCFFDTHLNIMFIRFFDININYIDINNYKFSNFNEFTGKINYCWLNNEGNIKNTMYLDSSIIFEDKFINLPSIPYIITNLREHDNEKNNNPITGSIVLNEKQQMIGIVCYVNKFNIISIPINLIIRSFDYLNFNPIYQINVKLEPIQIYLKNALTQDIISSGLYYTKKNISNKYSTQIYNVILSIDNYAITQNGSLLIDDYHVPLTTYLWLIKKPTINNIFIKIKGIPSKFINIKNIKTNEDNVGIYCEEIKKFCYYKIKLYNNTFPISNISYIQYKNKILIELNEQIMQLLQFLIQTTNNFDELYNYVNENKLIDKRILIMIDNKMRIKIIKKLKINNLYDFVSFLKNKKKLKKFLNDF
jgi:hypothetical protein